MNIMYQLRKFTIIIIILAAYGCNHIFISEHFKSYWDEQPDRYWIGPEYWSNRLQDWRIHNGRVECINGKLPLRTLHLTDKYVDEKPGNLHMTVLTGRISELTNLDASSFSGFLVGAGDLQMDWRARALIHNNHGNEGGIIAALNGTGKIVFIDNETGKYLESSASIDQDLPLRADRPVKLELQMDPRGNTCVLTLRASYADKGKTLSSSTIIIDRPDKMTGNIALIASGGADNNGQSFWYKDWEIKGTKLTSAPEQQLGPIIGTLYTLSNKILKLTVQIAPVSFADEQVVELDLMDKRMHRWKKISSSQLVIPGYTAHFRVDPWDSINKVDYRIRYKLRNPKGTLKDYFYYGSFNSDPVDKEEIIIAAFTGNSNSAGMDGGYFDFKNRMWFPHADLTGYVAKHHPDLLVYTGDNVYEGRPTPPDFSSPENTSIDYLYKWYMFYWAHGVLTRNIPAIVIPDDHDVYHGNLWGAGGMKAPSSPVNGIYPDYYKGNEEYWQQDQGGYILSPDLVNMIQRTQTSNLPDPYDQAPAKQGIGVYFCEMNYGRISFAILEDRKFKSAPGKSLPDIKIINGFPIIPWISGRDLDNPEAELLGPRQLKFLDEWSSDWKNTDMKVAISQTIFADLSTYPDTFITDAGTPRLEPLPPGVIPKDYRKAKDMDSNGWPQTGRNKALKELRKGFAFMIGGDQHLGSIIHHGIDEWEDAGFSFCVPSIANLWPRRWFPPEPGQNHQPGLPLYTGRYFDGFGNRITVWAVSNPYLSGKEPSPLYDRAPGYGIIRLNKKTQQITIECWPRYADPESPDAKQYPGWPLTVLMEDNYGRQPRLWLPPIQTYGLMRPPVVQVIDEETGEIVYTLRIRESSYQPKVFKYGTYTVSIGEPDTKKMEKLTGVQAKYYKEQDTLKLEF
jgi:alkaline phosphatase D